MIPVVPSLECVVGALMAHINSRAQPDLVSLYWNKWNSSAQTRLEGHNIRKNFY